ncbi:gluconate 2-dehydrogenase subunit 3 family protein [Robiginitalea sp. SC105]|uniref:gluconate 2-dehydrogenase subunit 3 family protein n=1 Tax=Robiginitalea sp. SC105 TaxID=2762332 RepID=UPI00163B283D|nr:gluconate 2-dehydrogenase subunit 3 family protein [Robiginitalea sp. SC105]MBC2838141.1 gluconate 2-dehydrogenase subunit 3 family protein [Robiginitalea sp. SC105]
MERREALQLTTALLGTTLVGSSVFLGSCSRPDRKQAALTDADIPLLGAMSDIILPKTESSPGAAEAGVGQFIKDMVTECYSLEEETRFETGLRELEARVQAEFGTPFTDLEPKDRTSVLTRLDSEARDTDMAGEPHFYNMLLQLTLWGYFTSEAGATLALRYNPTPGRYEGCIPYKPGDKAWA